MAQHYAATHGNTVRISLPHRFDIMSTVEFRVPFVRALGDEKAETLVVDFSNLGYIDSMGIGTLISWEQSCKDKGKSMVLERCDPKVMKFLKLAGVDRLFQFALPAT